MQTLVLVLEFFIAIALIGTILLQRSEGGALGIGGGGGMMSSRGAANALTKATSVLAIMFFATTITLAIMARTSTQDSSVVDRAPVPAIEAPAAPAEDDGGIPVPAGDSPATAGQDDSGIPIPTSDTPAPDSPAPAPSQPEDTPAPTEPN